MTNIFTAQRMDSDGQSTISRWHLPDGAPMCFCLEPGGLRDPYPGIPAGSYPLRLRTVGEKHAEYNRIYAAKFGIGWHRGMVEIAEVPGREAIEFHIGNTIADTLGCSLAGESFIQPPGNGSGHYEVARSRAAYERVYPLLRDAILKGDAQLTINQFGGALA